MITLRDFRKAAFEKKCEAITQESDYLTMRVQEEKTHYLYFMNNFFVEVVYSSPLKKVIGINAFSEVEQLAFYLEEVSLTSLVS